MAGPRLLGITEYDGEEPWMWIEDVGGESAFKWPVERFGVTARQFGRMQGEFLAGRPFPDEQWLETSGWLGVQLAEAAEPMAETIERIAKHPLTQGLWRSEFNERMQTIWARREALCEAMERGPKSLCHGDFVCGNLFDRAAPDGGIETAVIDWQYCGLRQIGGDIAALIADCSVLAPRRKVAEPEEFSAVVLDGYLSGLRESGWRGDTDLARFAVLARLGMLWLCYALPSIDAEAVVRQAGAWNREETEKALEEGAHRVDFLLRQAEAAAALLGGSGPLPYDPAKP
jgi:Ser/Thr protein kinase RdoA (MazF antagonist)